MYPAAFHMNEHAKTRYSGSAAKLPARRLTVLLLSTQRDLSCCSVSSEDSQCCSVPSKTCSAAQYPARLAMLLSIQQDSQCCSVPSKSCSATQYSANNSSLLPPVPAKGRGHPGSGIGQQASSCRLTSKQRELQPGDSQVCLPLPAGLPVEAV